jgi:putative ABC transport system substrate-binding protein
MTTYLRMIAGVATAATTAAVLAMNATAQQRPAQIGFVSWFSPTEAVHVEHLKQGLKDYGWLDGQSYQVEAHYTDGNRQRTREVVEALIRKPVDLLVVRATTVAHIAKEAIQTLPVVFMVSDPLATGIVPDLARPGGNMTGLSLQGPDLAGKRLELLRSIKPNLKTVAFLGSSADPNAATFVRQLQAAATTLSIELVVTLLEGPGKIAEDVFKDFADRKAEAIVVQPIFTGHQARIVPLAMKYRLAVVSNYTVFPAAGALLSFGPDDADQTRRAAYYVDRILKGAKPADLPVEQPSRFLLAINTETARQLGLTVPQSLLVAADEIYGAR